ncbi:hypothetical protein JCM9957A_30990 [Kineosporia succinea]
MAHCGEQAGCVGQASPVTAEASGLLIRAEAEIADAEAVSAEVVLTFDDSKIAGAVVVWSAKRPR